MNREIIRVIKTCDIGEYFRLVDEYPHAVTRCRILKDGEENFFQRALDKDISMADYLEGEESLLKLCDRIYKGNYDDAVIGFYSVNSSHIITNSYAKRTWGLKTRFILNLLHMKCLRISSRQLMRKMVQIGCREIEATFLYYCSEDLFICIDALCCVILTKTKEQALSYLEGMGCEHEIE